MAARQKILIVDDEPEILEIYQEILSRLPSGPEIHTSDTGARALALLESSIFQVILLDLRMSQMDGFQVLSIVRRKFPAVRVVVVTGAEDEQYRTRAYSMGVDLYLEKPKTGKEIIHFVDCIEALLERERLGGFRGIQSKPLADILQLECLTQSSAVLKVSAAGAEGRIWLYRGEVTDAAAGDLHREARDRGAVGQRKNIGRLDGYTGGVVKGLRHRRMRKGAHDACVDVESRKRQHPAIAVQTAEGPALVVISLHEGADFVLGESGQRAGHGFSLVRPDVTSWPSVCAGS